MEHHHNTHHQGHHHAHHHHHHAPVAAGSSLQGIFIFSIALNLLFVIIEAVIGFVENSLSLLSDAGHNLSDVFSLVLVLIAFYLAKKQSTHKYTYGYKKSTVLISLLNAIILLIAVGAIWIESIEKLCEPAEVNGAAVSWTAFVGILINGATAWLLMRGQKNDINVRGAFLHMVADTLVSVGVVVSGIIITYTGWNIVDPVVSILISFVILASTWRLLSESLKLSLDGMPEGIDLSRTIAEMCAAEHVKEVHHVHIWAISTTENALTAHVVVDDIAQMEEVKHALRQRLQAAGIQHATLEIEAEGSRCGEHDCKCG